MNKNEFVSSIREGALKGLKDYGILPSLTIAQAILESGWGRSELAVKANNLFGIKAFSDWTGGRISMETAEYENGERVIVNSDFRAYNSLNESIEDHNRLLSGSRYKAVTHCMSYKDACEEIYKCGYATDPGYPEKLIRIIEENRLYELDGVRVEIEENKTARFQELCNKLNIRDMEGKVLEVDYILGWRTRSCIGSLPVLRIGSKGAAVEFVQEVLKAEPIDGDFGPITTQCVIDYQRNKNLTVDGIVGRETWTILITT